MDENILNILSTYKVETIMMALLINILTNLVKKPIKACSIKSGKNINKYISLIPVILGFVGSILYCGFTTRWNLSFEKVLTFGLSSASLSLAIFAVFEKFFPKAKGQIIDKEAAATVIEVVENTYNAIKNKECDKKNENDADILGDEYNADKKEICKSFDKIILRRKK